MKLSVLAGSSLGPLFLAVAASSVPAAAQAPPPVRSQAAQGYNLAFVDADVRRVVDAVLGSMLELDYSVDPAVVGNITLRTRQPVAREQLLPLLESALRQVNAVLVVQGASYRVVPREGARNAAPLANGWAAAPLVGFAS